MQRQLVLPVDKMQSPRKRSVLPDGPLGAYLPRLCVFCANRCSAIYWAKRTWF